MTLRLRLALVLCLAPLAAVAACGSAEPGAALPVTPHGVPASATSHVVVLVMENKERPDVLGRGSSYLDRLARRSASLTRSYGVTHPSLPNYLALTSGSTHGITSDCTDCHVSAPNIATSLEARGRSWKGYMEDLPRPCFKGAGAKGYAKKHDPFLYYDDIANDPARCRRVVPLTQLARDLRAGHLPTYAFIAPNLCDDTHDCPVSTGDRFLARTVPSILRGLGPHGFLVLTWDEGTTSQGCCGGSRGGRIATVIAGPTVKRGYRLATPIDHYGVLATIERALGLAPLGASADARHGSFARVFTRAPHVR